MAWERRHDGDGDGDDDDDDAARIVSIAVPVAPLQIRCLFGRPPVFMRVLSSGRNSLIISLINSL
ncbi:MAG TPA: hypothetical protein VNX88_22025, partial [Terriglobales bacterium]|nr:hypothetical protein [Terriglobales bacterium]